MKKVKYYSNEVKVFAEFLRRYICFHNGENMEAIKLWGLFNYGEISKLIKKGHVITDYKKENKIIWCKPSKKIINEIIIPAFELLKNNTGIHDIYTHDYTSYIYKIIYNN
jgi:hypothetical protein